MTRQGFIKASAAVGAGLVFVPAPMASAATRNGGRRAANGDAFVEPDSTFFATAFTEYYDTYPTDSLGDLWPACWADDGNLYTSNGDGRGFSDRSFEDIVMNAVYGTPETGITGERLAAADEIADIWADPADYNRKPTGMVAVGGKGGDTLYVAVQDLRKTPGPPIFNDAPNASISKSADYGRTWQKTDEPMFPDHVFTTIFFLDYGQSNRNARVLGRPGENYVYAYGLDNNWRDSFSDTVEDPQDLYLARVPKQTVQNRATWQFYAGTGRSGKPAWSPDIDKKAPVLHDERRVYPSLFCDNGPENISVISQGGVVYNAPLKRYLYTSWTNYTFEFYEAPEPWGPWKLFMRKDFGGYPWYGVSEDPGCPGPKNGGYATVVPSKFISEDGKDMWVQSNWFGTPCGADNYSFSLRKFRVEPFIRTEPLNGPDPADNLAMSGEGASLMEKSAHYGNGAYYNDGVKDHSEDSFDCEDKDVDFWGYTFKRSYNFDRIAYTTGDMFSDGGWFESGLRVQVRRDFEWVNAQGLSITPEYPYSDGAGPNKTYTLAFDGAWGDGVRIIGKPGGRSRFTSIGELEAYFDGP